MMHLLAYTKASAGGVALEDLPGVQDVWASLNASSHYFLPQDMFLKFTYNLSPNVTAAQLSQPFLRAIALPAMTPYDIGTTPTSIPAVQWFEYPITTLKKTDELAVLQSDNAGGAIQKYAFLGVVDSNLVNQPQGAIIELRATTVTVANQRSWANVTFTVDQGIPYGKYAVVGMDVVGANVIAARLAFPAGGPRPGCLGRITHATKPDSRFRNGRLGTWGYFDSTAVPTIDIFGAGALSNPEVFLDVIKVA